MNGEIKLVKQRSPLLNYVPLLVLATSFIACWLFLQVSSINATTLAKGEEKELFYLALGDSLTAGIGATETNYLRLSAFVPQLTSFLREKQPVRVENHGIPGLTSGQLLRYLREGLGMDRKLAEADLITMTIGANDLLQLLAHVWEEKLNEAQLKTILQNYSRHMQEIFNHIRRENPTVPIYILDLYSPYGADHPLHQISTEVVSSFNAQLAQLADAEKHIYVVSVYPSFLNRERELTHILDGDPHPNDQGYRVILEAFQKFF